MGSDRKRGIRGRAAAGRGFVPRIVVAALLLAVRGPVCAEGADFDTQRAAVTASVDTQPEAAIRTLLQAGLAEGKPTQAIAETQRWLRQNQPKDPMLLYHAGQAAELSGDWKGAVALYQQFLKGADLASAEANDAAHGVYVLLLERLGDTAGAYAFGRNDGNRMVICPLARQFDTWFLDEASDHRRRDYTAVGKRLHACIQAGYPKALLTIHYDRYFRWLLMKMAGYCDHRDSPRVSPGMLAGFKALANAITHDHELRLALDWAVSVLAYNQARIAGQDAEPPLAEANALLERFPQHARWVQDGWAGGGSGRHYRNDPSKYWPHRVEEKMAPIVAAAGKLDPAHRAELFATWSERHYSDRVVRPARTAAVRDFLAATPDFVNSRIGAIALDKEWQKLSVAEAKALAPTLEQNANAEAAIIRAIAAGGSDLDKVLAAVRGPEAWRLESGDLDGRITDQLWHYCKRPGGNKRRDAEIATSKKLRKTLQGEPIEADAPPAERLAAFKRLWDDYRSQQPKIPGVAGQLRTAVRVTPQALPGLLRDPSPEAHSLARYAMAAGISAPEGNWKAYGNHVKVNLSHYDVCISRLANHYGGWGRLKGRYPEQYKPHPLEPILREVITESLNENRLAPWQVLAWVNTQFPEDNGDSVALMRKLVASPLWKQMPHEVRFGARSWFKRDAMTPDERAWSEAADSAHVCRDLIALPDKADPAATAAALEQAVEGLRAAPVRVGIRGLDRLTKVTDAAFTDGKVTRLMLRLIDDLRVVPGEPEFGSRLLKRISKTPHPVVVHQAATVLWAAAEASHRKNGFGAVRDLAASLVKPEPSAARSLARIGLALFGNAHGDGGFKPDKDLPALKAISRKAALQMGLVSIPVAKNHPAYPIYKAQGDWLLGNEESAWKLVDEHWDQLMPVHRELAVDYLMWLLQRIVYSRDETRQETYVKALQEWVGDPSCPLSLSQRIDLDLAYGDIAVQRGMLREARELFTRTFEKAAYKDETKRYQALLRRVMVSRIAKDYDAALQTLMDMELERIPELWSAIRYARAEVYYDMEEFDDAADEVAAILAREPDHSDAKIMQGKLHIKRQQLMEATEVELGSISSQERLVPGEKLKVTLSDPTLAVSGAGTEVEVVVWTSSGDREHIFLRQFGDQRTKLRGEIGTALGAPAEDDGVLQLVGDDEVRYAYSENFRSKVRNLPESQGGPITVASDALLMVSARRLLSEAEQRVADMEAEMAAIGKGKVTKATAFAARARAAAEAGREALAGIDQEEAEALDLAREQTRLQQLRLKPGNPIHVRVVDPDRSRTAAIDSLTVSVESSSGDRIGRITLNETGPYTGWFEGHIPTSGAQAMAFAPNSEPGRNPNMVISPRTDYPAWRPVAAKNRRPEFRIDLNDNVPLGAMTITSREAGAKVKTFVLATGMNPRDMTTVAVFPSDQMALESYWHPSVTLMNDTDHHHVRNERSVYELNEMRAHINGGWMKQQYAQGFSRNIAGPSTALDAKLPKDIRWRRANRHDVSHVIYRFRGFFHEPKQVTRRFKLELGTFQIPKRTHPSVNHPPEFLLAVNGRPITDPKKPRRLEGEVALRPGLHRFEIWATGWVNNIGFGRDVKLLANLDDPEELSACPDSFFDPATFPEGVLSHRNGKATITAEENGIFKVAFAPGSRARLLRLVLIDQQGPVPALNRITLNTPDGRRVLPVAEDFATLNKNDTLEILTGDRVSVRYVDDRFATRNKDTHERFLNVAFSDGAIAFKFFEMRKNLNGVDFEYFENLLRCRHDEPILVTVHDQDMDVSPERDTVKITLTSESGGTRQVTATESESSPGRFELWVTPVAGPPQNGDQFQLGKGETLRATYRDQENLSPGVPTDRTAAIRHALYQQPRLYLSHATVTAMDPDAFDPPLGASALNVGFERLDLVKRPEAEGLREAEGGNSVGGSIRPRWSLNRQMIDVAAPPEGGLRAAAGRLLHIDVTAPQLALRTGSQAAILLQTDAGRKLARRLTTPGDDQEAPPGFDPEVPGTRKLGARLVGLTERPVYDWRQTPLIPIYRGAGIPPSELPAEIRFSCSIPLIPGELPRHGVLTAAEEYQRRRAGMPPDPPGLVVQPGERVHIGFRYTDPTGAERWLKAATRIITHPVLDVMDETYRDVRKSAYVGEALYLRVVDLGGDTSADSDTVTVTLEAGSGASHEVELLEVDTRSGIFRLACPLTYATPDKVDTNVRTDGFPVVYGDTVSVHYTDANGVKVSAPTITIRKGADGDVEPFSKRYTDPEVASRTQFALAESYLSVAKHHRSLKQHDRAQLEYDRAKQLLAGAMEQFRDPTTRAHALYLLGNLTQEEADATADDAELQQERYRAALARFMSVIGSYPDTIYASKAQFKIATVYEKLGEPDIAAQEYVKLAYKYPDSEFLGLAMARLGTHFLRTAARHEKKAKQLLAQEDDRDAQHEGTAQQKLAEVHYLKSANIFGRLQERFPEHELAGKAGLRAGQAYMRAQNVQSALEVFLRIVGNEGYDGPTIRAEAMYWSGMCYEQTGQTMPAYAAYKRLTYDFPESKWAAYARAQLSQERLLRLEAYLEIKRLEEGQ